MRSGGCARPSSTTSTHYEKLLRRQARVEIVEVREDEALERRIPERAYVVLLDAGGRELSSEALRRVPGGAAAGAAATSCFVLGGPFGTALERHDTKLSLGPMTLPHQLARVVLLEQLFRAHKILAGEPYHH